MNLSRPALIIPILFLAACATQAPEPKIKTVPVNLAAPVSCVPADLAPPPAYTDTPPALKAAPDFAGRYQLLAANHAVRATREGILEAVVDACRKAAPPP